MKSSNEISNSSECFVSDDLKLTFAYKFGNFLALYFVPILILFGFIGNILSVIVFSTRKFRGTSLSSYCIALGISDTIVLLDLTLQWITRIAINIYNENFFCQVFTFVRRVARFASFWLVFSSTVDRFIAVRHPLKRQNCCTVRRARFIIVGLVQIGLVLKTPYLVFVAPHYDNCSERYSCEVIEEYKVRVNFDVVSISSPSSTVQFQFH